MIFQLVRNNSETTEEEILLNRAFQAAQSGVQLGLNAVFPPAPLGTSSCPGIGMSTIYELEEDGLSACTADVTCSSIDVDDVDYVTIVSTGTCGDVSRTVQVRAK
jgi:MSHA biogenesis protein MshP